MKENARSFGRRSQKETDVAFRAFDFSTELPCAVIVGRSDALLFNSRAFRDCVEDDDDETHDEGDESWDDFRGVFLTDTPV